MKMIWNRYRQDGRITHPRPLDDHRYRLWLIVVTTVAVVVLALRSFFVITGVDRQRSPTLPHPPSAVTSLLDE